MTMHAEHGRVHIKIYFAHEQDIFPLFLFKYTLCE